MLGVSLRTLLAGDEDLVEGGVDRAEVGPLVRVAMVEPYVGDLPETLELQVGRAALDVERGLQRAGHHVRQDADLAGGLRQHDRRRGQSPNLRQVLRDAGDHEVTQVQPVQVRQPHAELVGGAHGGPVVDGEHRLVRLEGIGHQGRLPGTDDIRPHRVPDQQQHRNQAEPHHHQQHPAREADRREHPGCRGLGQRDLGDSTVRNGRLGHDRDPGQLDGHRDCLAEQQAYGRLAQDAQQAYPHTDPDPDRGRPAASPGRPPRRRSAAAAWPRRRC